MLHDEWLLRTLQKDWIFKEQRYEDERNSRLGGNGSERIVIALYDRPCPLILNRPKQCRRKRRSTRRYRWLITYPKENCFQDWKTRWTGSTNWNRGIAHTERDSFHRVAQRGIISSARKTTNICGLYTSYSLSSSSDCLKCEPYIITLSDNKDHIRIGRLNAYDEVQWGIGVNGDPQNFYCMFSENPVPPLTLVTVYLQIPMFKNPRQLRGLYLGLDYNRNPVARRIVLIKESESTDIEEFLAMKNGLIAKEDFTPEQQSYYDYTCQTGDTSKCAPSLLSAWTKATW